MLFCARVEGNASIMSNLSNCHVSVSTKRRTGKKRRGRRSSCAFNVAEYEVAVEIVESVMQPRLHETHSPSPHTRVSRTSMRTRERRRRRAVQSSYGAH